MYNASEFIELLAINPKEIFHLDWFFLGLSSALAVALLLGMGFAFVVILPIFYGSGLAHYRVMMSWFLYRSACGFIPDQRQGRELAHPSLYGCFTVILTV